MKSSSSTTYVLDFPMKDGKKVHSFKMPATSQEAAEVALREELMQCIEQLDVEKKKRIKPTP